MINLNNKAESIRNIKDLTERKADIQIFLSEEIKKNPKEVLILKEDYVKLNNKYENFLEECIADLVRDETWEFYDMFKVTNYRNRTKYEEYKTELIKENSFINIIRDIRKYKQVSCPYGSNATIKNNFDKEVVMYWKNPHLNTGIFIIKLKTKYLGVKFISNMDKDSYIHTPLKECVEIIEKINKTFGRVYINKEHIKGITQQVEKETMRDNLKKL